MARVIQPRDPLARRIAAVRSRIGNSLSDGKSLDEIHDLVKDLEVLESLALRRARRRSVRWVIAAIAALLALAVILAAMPLGSADVRVVADLRAFVMSTADHTENLLIDAVALTSIVTDGSGGAACWRVGNEPSLTCSVVADLRSGRPTSLSGVPSTCCFPPAMQ
jgi:hypothetical protein